MTRRYFGTDGVRGRVGEPPLTPDFALRLGWAAGRVLAREPGARVLIGKDTRRSGYMFESALEAGFAAAGVETDLLGPLPTPGVAYLTRALRAQAGVVISASHNPHYDNGVKLFSAEGDKLSDALEMEIESLIDQPLQCVAPEHLGRARRIDDAQGRYIEFCKGTYGGGTLRGMRLVVDCAHGAAYRVAPAVFDELGADVVAIGDRPDGFNINAECGSTHMASLTTAVAAHAADVGIALDGDGDRCLMVQPDGTTVDGDEILYIIARRAAEQGRLRGPVVGTVMTNFGLERAFRHHGIAFERAAVGDRYVLEKLRALGGILGGETSGHTLCLDRATTGDGIVTALQVLEAVRASGQSLRQLLTGMDKLPQVLINVAVQGNARDVAANAALRQAEGAIQKALGTRGRVLLRASGTEPVVRVMVEAVDADEAQRAAQELAEHVRQASGGTQRASAAVSR